MNESQMRVCLKIGEFEVEYEGDISLLKESNLSNPINIILQLYKQHREEFSTYPLLEREKSTDMTKAGRKLDFSISTVAGRLDAKTCQDLAVAAASYLTFVEERNEFTSKEILAKMKEAQFYYRVSMSNNLSNTLGRLVKGSRLNQTNKGMYSLSIDEKKIIESKLV